MLKPLVVFGATGQQGGSVVRYVLNDTELSQQYSIRAVTRDLSSSSAQALKQQKNVEVVQADLTDPSSLTAALRGAHTAFVITAPTFDADAKAKELAQGKNVADAAVAEGVHYLIFSTLPHVAMISGGKYTKVTAFDAKAEVEAYIRTLRPKIKSAFFAPAGFMQNFQRMMVPRPMGKDGEYAIQQNISPQTQMPSSTPSATRASSWAPSWPRRTSTRATSSARPRRSVRWRTSRRR